MQSFREHTFRSRIEASMRTVKQLLDLERSPALPPDVPHKYGDKYNVVNVCMRTARTALTSCCLAALGLSEGDLAKLRKDVQGGKAAVTLRFCVDESCTFDREETREEESKTKSVTETTSWMGKKGVTHKHITKITEYFWNLKCTYKLVAFKGVDVSNAVILQQREATCEVKTHTKSSPHPENTTSGNHDVDLSWLLGEEFCIDRADVKTCHTPRRNKEVTEAIVALQALYTWCGIVSQKFRTGIFPKQQNHHLNTSLMKADDVFVPVLPLFEEKKKEVEADADQASGDSAGVVLSQADFDSFLKEEHRSLGETLTAMAKLFPDGVGFITAAEANLVVVLQHIRDVCIISNDVVDYVEELLRRGLVAAIGKEVGPQDFAAYMRYHNRKLFLPEYTPAPFCYAVRRPDHYPEGVLSIETEDPSGDSPPGTMLPVPTTVRHIEEGRAMTFALDAATNVSFGGHRYLHAMIAHKFSHTAPAQMYLTARARQFSSFVLMVGRIVSATQFDPKAAIIVQNKDDLRIPLLMEQIPTPKEFRDAIESLSPEQQRFATAFRALQLEATLVGVCVIQIKPQLERLLNLPDDSLTKEIKLTQELLELFIKYQIPSDQLKWDGAEDAAARDKLDEVKAQVKAMREMVGESKREELKNVAEEAIYGSLGQVQPTVEYRMEREMLSRDMMCGSARGGGGGGPPPPPMMAMAMSAAPAPPCSAVMATAGGAPPPPEMRKMKKVMKRGGGPPRSAPPPSAPGPAPVQRREVKEVKPKPSSSNGNQRPTEAQVGGGGGSAEDLTQDVSTLPGLLDKRFEALDEDSALRPTIIKTGDDWRRKCRRTLLGEMEDQRLSSEDIQTEKKKAFDLLDALSRSGSLPIEAAALHVVVAATHCFDKTLMDTVIQGNVNPIEKVERSELIVATAVHGKGSAELLEPSHAARVEQLCPKLFATETGALEETEPESSC